MNKFFEGLSDSDFTKRFDDAVLTLIQAVETIGINMEIASSVHHTALSVYCELGWLVAKMDFAASMAEEYLRRELWKQNPDRIETDECNLGTYLFYLGNDHLAKTIKNKKYLLHFTEDMEFHSAGSAVRVSKQLIAKDNEIDLVGSLQLGFIEVVRLLKTIVVAEQKDAYDPTNVKTGGSGTLSMPKKEYDDFDVISMTKKKILSFEEDLNEIADNMPTFCYAMVRCLDQLRWLESGVTTVDNYIYDCLFEGYSIDKSFSRIILNSLTDEKMGLYQSSLAMLEQSYRKMAETPDVSMLSESLFPVTNHSKVIFDLTRPFISLALTLFNAIDDVTSDFTMRLADGFAYTINDIKKTMSE